MRNLITITLVLAITHLAGAATTYTWSVTSGNWSTPGSWTPGTSTAGPTSADTAVLGTADTTSSQTTVNNVVDVSFTGTITALTYNQTTSGQWHVTQIPVNQTLTVSGVTTVGGSTSGSTANTQVAMTGAGTFAANGNLTIGNNDPTTAGATATLDLSGLTNFVYNNSGGTITMATGVRSTGNLKLAQTNVITVGTWNDNTASTSSSGTGNLTLGAATNIINVGTFNIAEGRAASTVSFPASTTSPLRLRGSAGTDSSRATMKVGIRNNSGGTGGTTTGTVTLNGHAVDMKLGTLTIGRDSNTSATGADTGTGTFSFDTGTVDVTTVNMAITAANANSAANGTITVGASGSLIIGGLSLANKNASSGAATGTLNISGGTVTCNGSIRRPAPAAPAASFFPAAAHCKWRRPATSVRPPFRLTHSRSSTVRHFSA